MSMGIEGIDGEASCASDGQHGSFMGFQVLCACDIEAPKPHSPVELLANWSELRLPEPRKWFVSI